MANQYVNKLVKDGVTKFDLTNDTVTPETLAEGVTAHDASGSQITGTAKLVGNIDLSSENVTVSKTSTTVTVTLSNATGAVSIVKNGDNFNAALSGNTITITKTGPFAENGTVIVAVAETTTHGAVSKTITVTVEGATLCTWADGTDEEVTSMIEAAQNGDIDLIDYWAAGDCRVYNGINYYLSDGVEYTDENGQTQTSIFSIIYIKGSKTVLAKKVEKILNSSTYYIYAIERSSYSCGCELPQIIVDKTKFMRLQKNDEYWRKATSGGQAAKTYTYEYRNYCFAPSARLFQVFGSTNQTYYVKGGYEDPVNSSPVKSGSYTVTLNTAKPNGTASTASMSKYNSSDTFPTYYSTNVKCAGMALI